ncbi:MAG: asparagine synthase (glutamine-hydrolyzing) [Lachnospiraceae bacterium]|nr:asparagine synthase (glutamine-hydrolyzing) [Lachnospiraceae bacterium]
MCGIAGFVDRQLNQIQVVREMTARMKQRGPDGSGEWADETSGVTFGHRRLAILDLSENGAQPMTSACGRYVLTYNGEIYNADLLRKEVLAYKKGRGESFGFRGTSDTEALLEAMALFGTEKALLLAKGMFAFALYDRKEHVLTLARDRAGEKPLYYGFAGGNFVFASDLAALSAYPKFEAEIDRRALHAYMRYGFVPAPYSVYKGIRKLLPGYILTLRQPFSDAQAELHAYWSMAEAAESGRKNPFQGSRQEAADELERLLSEAIREQMISDVPIGAFLSGGIDSPLIAALMQKQSSAPVRTFTIGFDEKKYNEAEYAKEIAAHLGTEHTELYVTEKELLDVIPGLSNIFSEPFADSSQIPTCLVSRLAKTKVTVSLSGDAGDELFCGYNTYPKIASLAEKLETMPKGLRAFGGAVLEAGFWRGTGSCYRIAESLRARDIIQLHEAVCYHTDYGAERLVLFEDEAERRAVRKRDFAGTEGGLRLPGEAFYTDPKRAMMYKDMVTYHPDDILVKVDRAGMAVSLENRVPMLDRDVIEFAYRLPMEYLYGDGGVSKQILKDILYRYVPKELLDRPKKGFSVPLARWLKTGHTADWAWELLENNRLAQDGIFDKRALKSIRARFAKGRANPQIIWEILMAEQWYRGLRGKA